MNKFFLALTAAAVISAGIVVLPAMMASKVEAAAPASAHATVKSDRLDVRTFGADCSQRAWPHYEAGCLRDADSSTFERRTVRVVSTDKL